MAGSSVFGRQQAGSKQAAQRGNQEKRKQRATSQPSNSKPRQAEMTLTMALKTLCSVDRNNSIVSNASSSQCKYQRAIQGLLMNGSMLILVLVALQLAATTSGVRGAQSEVWSESVGLRMAYSTNHDDLLSTKGSDLSLSTDRHQAGPGQTADHASSASSEPDASTGGEEAAHSSPPTSEKSTSDESSPAEVAHGGSGGEPESPVSAPAADGEEEAQDTGASNREQAADSSSRLNDKVPPTGMGRVESYSTSGQHSFKQSHRAPAVIKSHSSTAGASGASGRFDKAPRTEIDSDDDQSDDEQVASRHTSKSAKSLVPPARQRDLTFDSSEPGEKSDNNLAAALEDEPQGAGVGADADDMDGTRLASDERTAKGSYGASKFKQPSRLFKEAVRMIGPQKGADEDSSGASHSSEGDDDQSDKSSSGEASDSTSPPTGSSSSSRQQSQQHDDESSRDSDDKEAEYGGPQSESKQVGTDGGRGNMIDFEQYPTAPRRHLQQFDTIGRAFNQAGAFNVPFDGQPAGGPEQQTFGGPASAFVVDQEDESANRNQFRPPFYDNSGQSSRSTPTSAAQSERPPHGQAGAHYTRPHQHSKQQASSSPLPPGHAHRASGSANPQAYKQLSYFKSLADHQQPASGPGPVAGNKASLTGSARLTSSARSPPVVETADVDSPDNVRDNFISPGHYPGSMAHLTQAASEVKAKSAPEIAASASSSSKPETNSMAVAKSQSQSDERTIAEQQSSQQTTVTGSQQLQQQQQLEPSVAAASEPIKQLAVSSSPTESPKADELASEPTASSTSQLALVTPMPESQQEESQQIMAPILQSTTTMAPMLPTTSPAIGSTAAPESTTAPTSTTSTSSQAPSLKRFKFRKYR